MAINPPQERVWWNEPVARGELVWISIAFVWGIIMFFMMMPYLFGRTLRRPAT
jgi:cytochrome c oxidase subunit II